MKRKVILSILFVIVVCISALLYIYGQSHQILLDFPSDVSSNVSDSKISNIFDVPTEFFRVTIDNKEPVDVVLGERSIVYVNGPRHTIKAEYSKDGVVIQSIKKKFKLKSFYVFLFDLKKLIVNEEKWFDRYIEETIDFESIDTSIERVETEIVPVE